MHLKRFLLIYFCFLMAGLLSISASDLLFIFQADTTLGAVISHKDGETKEFHKPGGRYVEQLKHATFGYKVEDRLYTVTANEGCADGCSKIGQKAMIFYEPSDPANARINNMAELWKYEFYFLVIAVVMFICLMPYIYVYDKKSVNHPGADRTV